MRKYHFDHPLDSPMRTLSHREIINGKKVLRDIYLGWYELFLQEMAELPTGKLVELGSGGGFLKELEPSVVSSDIIDLPSNDMTFSALDMPFPDQSVSGLFMVDTMHHIPDSNKFLKEAERVLLPGGKIVMLEPVNSLWGKFIYKTFHHEPFNPEGDWTIPATGPLSGANGALPWIVFVRDRRKFDTLFRHFKVESITYMNPLSYLFSGGVSRKQFLPDFMFPVIRFFDGLLPKINKQFSMFMYIKIRRT